MLTKIASILAEMGRTDLSAADVANVILDTHTAYQLSTNTRRLVAAAVEILDEMDA